MRRGRIHRFGGDDGNEAYAWSDPEEVTEAKADSKSSKSRPARKVVETDEEMGDDALLGKSTLAKMAKPEEVAPVAEEAKKPDEPAGAVSQETK